MLAVMILVLIFLGIVGLLMLLKPDLYWEIESFFFVKDGEPTDLSIMLIRIRGITCLIIMLMLTFVAVKYVIPNLP